VRVLLAALSATAVLTALRAWALDEALRGPPTPAAWRLAFGEASFWGVSGLAITILHSLSPARLRPHLATTTLAAAWLVFLVSAADVASFAVTGARVDAEMLRLASRSLHEIWPVVWSEVRSVHIAGAVVFGAAIAALRWIPLPNPSTRSLRAALAVACVSPALGVSMWGHPKVPRSVQPLREPLVSRVWAMAHAPPEEPLDPADPLTLAPVVLGGVTADVRLPNVVLVILESTGARHTSLGRPRRPGAQEPTPVLARLAAEGLWAPHHTTVVPHTSKSLIATLCATEPLLRGTADDAQPGGVPSDCLPTLLRGLGYRTGFFQTADDRFEDRAGVAHGLGFETVRGRDAIPQAGYPRVNYFGWDEDAMRAPGMAWASEDPGRPFFQTWLTLSAHHDYGLPRGAQASPLAPGQDPRATRHGDAVRAVDQFLGRLLSDYDRRGLLDDTLVIVQGDHGEAFGEHGRKQHDLVIWEEGLRVPLVLWGAPLQGRTGTIDGPRSVMDVVPTVLDVIGAPAVGGRPLPPSLLDPVAADRRLLHACWRTRGCTAERTGQAKIIDLGDGSAVKAYDLQADPEEGAPQALSEADANAARARIGAWRRGANGRWEARQAAYRAARTRPAEGALADRRGAAPLTPAGCDRASAAHAVPGEVVWVRCRWRVPAPIRESLRVQVQAGDAAPEPAALPMGGTYPTHEWPSGHTVEVDHRVRVPEKARPGPLPIRIQWLHADGSAVAPAAGPSAAPAVEVYVR
jgi:arylsulfatase A-like enzyme